jgi:ubiquinone biosynthesis protein Coq4
MKKFLLKIRSVILVFLTHQVALPLLKLLRKPNLFPHSLDEIGKFPQGTLGNDLYQFLSVRNLPLLKHYARHDLKHVLLGYDTTDEGEACLQSFMFGNGRVSFPVLATIFYSFVTMPEHWNKMRAAYQMGKQSAPFHHWKWNELLNEPTELLRQKIFNNH